EGWRGRPSAEQGYGPGNVVNLLRLQRGDLRGLDLSRLALRQVYLADTEAQDASLAGADLAEAVLAEAFGGAVSIALSADGAYLAAGALTGEVRVWRVGRGGPGPPIGGAGRPGVSLGGGGGGRRLARGGGAGA